MLPEDFNGIQCDLAYLDTLELSFQPDFIYFMPSAGMRDIQTYRNIYTIGAQKLIKFLYFNKLTPKRLFYISSTSVYSENDGSWVNEKTIIKNSNPYTACLIAGEDFIRQHKFPYTIVRFGGIYGPGRSYLIKQIKSGNVYRNQNPVYVNNIHQEDCSGILEFLMLKPNPSNLYIGVDSEPSNRNTVIEWLCQKYKLRLPNISNSDQIIRSSNKRCSNQLIISEGYKFIYPSFKEGYSLQEDLL